MVTPDLIKHTQDCHGLTMRNVTLKHTPSLKPAPPTAQSNSLRCVLAAKHQTAQYGFFFLGLNVHFDRFSCRNCLSVTVGRIFEFVHCPINLCGVSNECNLNGISYGPCELGVVPIHYKYFLRNLTLHDFLLSPEVWNIRASTNFTVMS